MKRPGALAPLAGLLAALLVLPFLAGLGQAGLADWSGTDIGGLARAGAVSVASATAATALVAVCGIPLGYLLARVPGRGMALLGFVVQLPLALPPLASGVLLLFLLGYASPLGRLTHGALTDSFLGIVLAEAFVAAPFLIVAARSAFAGVDPVLEDVAATLGHRPGAVFRRVSLALAFRGIWAGLLLTWLRAFGEFGATVMVAYHPYSVPVYTYVAFGSEGLPAMLPILLPTILIAAGVMALSLRAGRARPARRTLPGTPPLDGPAMPPRPVRAPGQPLSFAFQRRRDGFTLDVAWQTEGRRLCILGASGSGKSATLRLIAGLDRADGATLTLNGRDLAAMPPHARGIGYVPQNYGLLPNLTVARQVRFAVTADPAQAEHWTRRLGLAGLRHRLPADLSLGQQQRVALARALSCQASLLLLDEPFSALDAPLRARLRDELLALQGQIEATTILVSHDPAEAMLLADELLLLEDGRVLQSGPVEDVFRRPASEAAARLLGARNIAPGQAILPDTIDIGGVHLAVAGPPLSNGPVGWAVRPEAIRIDATHGLPATLLSAGVVRAGQRWMTVSVGHAVLQAVAGASSAAAPGPCRVLIDSAAVQVWPARQAEPASAVTAPDMAA